MNRAERVVSGCLVGVIVALMSVGYVTGTPLRHTIQVLPAVASLALLTLRFKWASWAALAVFGFWLLIMVAIWLWLLGVARIITGHFTSPEVALTVVIGLSAAVGTTTVVRSGLGKHRAGLLASFLLAGALQVISMWLSLQPFAEAR